MTIYLFIKNDLHYSSSTALWSMMRSYLSSSTLKSTKKALSSTLLPTPHALIKYMLLQRYLKRDSLQNAYLVPQLFTVLLGWHILTWSRSGDTLTFFRNGDTSYVCIDQLMTTSKCPSSLPRLFPLQTRGIPSNWRMPESSGTANDEPLVHWGMVLGSSHIDEWMIWKIVCVKRHRLPKRAVTFRRWSVLCWPFVNRSSILSCTW